MDGWRRQKAEINYQEVHRTRSNYRKPPVGCWQATVPSWEKKFCALVGLVPWRKLIETKKFMHLYDNVVQWNDSAGEEAFHNAKNRFWAEMNGLPCDLSLPDPDIYIDEIDWNSNIDPELLLDLERELVVPVGRDRDEKVVILGNALLVNQSFTCNGWGEAEEDSKKVTMDGNENSWECGFAPVNTAVEENGWGNCWNNASDWDQWESNIHASEHWKVGRTDGDWSAWNGNNRKREGTGCYMSRYKSLKFYGDENQTDNGWRNGRGRKVVNFVYERPCMDRRPASRKWN